jgi:hypothetical protein
MTALRLQQQIARALLARGVSGELIPVRAGELLLVVADVTQLEKAHAAIAAYPEVTLITA